MSEPAAHEERLTEYERAICYSTIPRITLPFTYGLIAGYAVALLGALLAMVYGLRNEGSIWEQWGMIVFGIVIVLGVVGFLARAITNQVHERSALAEAEMLPNVESGFDELPDPFEGHTLLRRSRHLQGDTIEITDNRGRTVYTVVKDDKGHGWKVNDALGNPTISISAAHGARSFDLSAGTPSQVSVSREGAETAVVIRRPGFRAGVVNIESRLDGECNYLFKSGGFYKGNDPVGRIYFIRSFTYLDIRKSALNDGTLALFIAMIS